VKVIVNVGADPDIATEIDGWFPASMMTMDQSVVMPTPTALPGTTRAELGPVIVAQAGSAPRRSTTTRVVAKTPLRMPANGLLPSRRSPGCTVAPL